MHFPRFFWMTNYKLFDFFKLMNAKNPPDIFAAFASFLAEASGDTTIHNRFLHQIFFVKPFIHVEAANRLFRCGNQIFAVFLVLFSSRPSYMVQSSVEICQLCDATHDALVHEVWRLQKGII